MMNRELVDGWFTLISQIDDVTDLVDRIEVKSTVEIVSQCSVSFDLWVQAGVLSLIIEGERLTSWEELQGFNSKNDLTLVLYKNVFLEYELNGSADIGSFVFFTEEHLKTWLDSLPSSLEAAHPFHKKDQNIIWLYGLDESFRSQSLSVLSFNDSLSEDSQFSADLVYLPVEEQIKSQVHFISSSPMRIDLIKFRLPDEAASKDFLSNIFFNYECLLLSCFLSEFHSLEKVIVTGIKRLSLKLISDEEWALSIENIRLLEESVSWVYDEKCETRLLLLIDRLSLDIEESCCFAPHLYCHLKPALDQARYRYEFVIKDRKEAHAKELLELQKDIKTATDSYSESTNKLISGFLTDALTTIFILSIGLLSKLIGGELKLDSPIVQLLFTGLAIYLIFSFVIRVVFSYFKMKFAVDDLSYWSGATRNHMSQRELSSHIVSRSKKYKNMYYISIALVALIYVCLAGFVYKLPEMAKQLNELESNGLEVQKNNDVNSAEASEQNQSNDKDVGDKARKQTPAAPKLDAGGVKITPQLESPVVTSKDTAQESAVKDNKPVQQEETKKN